MKQVVQTLQLALEKEKSKVRDLKEQVGFQYIQYYNNNIMIKRLLQDERCIGCTCVYACELQRFVRSLNGIVSL